MAKRVYLDSSVILAFLKGEAGRGEHVKAALFTASTPGSDLQFVTSVHSLIEITYIENLPGSLEDGFSRIDDFWGTAPIQLIEVNEVAVIRGRAMMRERLRSGQQPELPSARKRAADPVHLSTAIWLKVDEFWTYDGLDFSKYPQQDVTVREPYGEQMLMPGVDL